MPMQSQKKGKDTLPKIMIENEELFVEDTFLLFAKFVAKCLTEVHEHTVASLRKR